MIGNRLEYPVNFHASLARLILASALTANRSFSARNYLWLTLMGLAIVLHIRQKHDGGP